MLKFKVKKISNVTVYNPENESESIEFKVFRSGIVNKTEFIMEHITEILSISHGSDVEYYKILKEFKDTSNKDVIYNNIDKFSAWAKTYQLHREADVPFDNFANKSKATKNSIFITCDNIKKLYQLTCCLKMLMPYLDTSLVRSAIFSDAEQLQKNLFILILKVLDCEPIISSLYQVIQSKIFNMLMDDSNVWHVVYKKHTMSENTLVYVMFDFIISVHFSIYNLQSNPVTFIVASCKEMVGWEITDLYNKSVVYQDTKSEFLQDSAVQDLSKHPIYKNLLNVIKDVLQNHFDSIDIPFAHIRYEYEAGDSLNFLNLCIVAYMAYALNIQFRDINIIPNTDKYLLQLYLYYILDKLTVDPDSAVKFTHTCGLLRSKIHPLPEYINGKKRVYTTYSSKCSEEILANDFNYHGIKNRTILYKYINSLLTELLHVSFTPMFGSRIVKSKFKIANVEKEMLPLFVSLLCKMSHPISDVVKREINETVYKNNRYKFSRNIDDDLAYMLNSKMIGDDKTRHGVKISY